MLEGKLEFVNEEKRQEFIEKKEEEIKRHQKTIKELNRIIKVAETA